MIHRELAVPVQEIGVKKVFTHGQDMIFLREELPDEKLGEHCENAFDCAYEVANL